MSSKERIFAALTRKPVDYVPCVAGFWPDFKWNKGKWTPDDEVMQVWKNEFGLDPWIHVGGGMAELKTEEKKWVENVPGEEFPIVHKEIITAQGKLTVACRKSEDWPHGDDVPVHGSDWASARYVKPWIENPGDVEALANFFQPIDSDPRRKEEVKRHIIKQKQFADKWGIPVIGGAGYTLDWPIHLIGSQKAIFISMDNPLIIDRLLEIIDPAQEAALKHLVSLGINIFLRRGWYDTMDFWTPDQFKKWVFPRLKKTADYVHSQGGLLIYQCCTGVQPLIPYLKELEIDCLMGIEPALGGQDMRLFKKELEGKSFWGGVSDPVHLRTTPEAARAAVREAFAIFGKTGFLLSAVPSIKTDRPWENVLAFMDEWKKMR